MYNVKVEYNNCAYLFDRTLSLKAKGIMAMMVAYINKHSSEGGAFTLADVKDLCSDGTSAFANALTELKDHGYVIQTKTGNGFKGTIWMFTLKE